MYELDTSAKQRHTELSYNCFFVAVMSPKLMANCLNVRHHARVPNAFVHDAQFLSFIYLLALICIRIFAVINVNIDDNVILHAEDTTDQQTMMISPKQVARSHFYADR